MRTFIVALSIFLLVTGFLFFDSYYITHLCANLLQLADALPVLSPPSPSETEESEKGTADGQFPMPSSNETSTAAFAAAYRAFQEKWEKTETTFHILMGHNDADIVADDLEELGIRFLAGDTAGYMAARGHLIQTLQQIQKDERIALDSIL